METDITKNGVVINETKGTESEMAALKESYSHLAKLRDEVIGMGIIPTVDQWKSVNPNL